MNRYTLCAILLLLAIGCKKKTDSDGQTTPYNPCPANVYGYKAVPTYMGITDTLLSTFGTINLSTGLNATVGAFRASIYTNNGAWNSIDHCYYTFYTQSYESGDSKLYKMSSSGSLTTLTPAAGNGYGATDLVYNKVTNKLYCICKRQLAEVNVTDSNYSITLVGPPFLGFGSSLTVDNNTGNFYYYLFDTISKSSPNRPWRIEKYIAGAAAPVTVYADSTPYQGLPAIIGLRHNSVDNKLYGFEQINYSKCSFVRIDPSSSTLDSLYEVDNMLFERYSACIDACSNTYIVSYGYYNSSSPSTSQFFLKQISTTGELLHSHVSNYIFQGLVSTY